MLGGRSAVQTEPLPLQDDCVHPVLCQAEHQHPAQGVEGHQGEASQLK